MDTSFTASYHLDFAAASERLKNIVNHAPLQVNNNLSRKYRYNVDFTELNKNDTLFGYLV
jgi:hypothetical protein